MEGSTKGNFICLYRWFIRYDKCVKFAMKDIIMKKKIIDRIYLPGGSKQFEHLKNNVLLEGSIVLILGSNCEQIAKKFLDANADSVSVIVDDYDSLLKTRFLLKENRKIDIRLMNYSFTDFKSNKFDVVFAQGSISTPTRNKIIKEIKRLTNSDGIISIGELICLKKNPPALVTDIWERSNIFPLNEDEIDSYYQKRNFEIISKVDLSDSLKDFYIQSKGILDQGINSLSESEKSYYKKILKRMSHESNAYLNLGASEYMGISSIVLKPKKP